MLSFPLLSLQFTLRAFSIMLHIHSMQSYMCTRQIYGKAKKWGKKKKHKAFTLTTICRVTPSISKLVRLFSKEILGVCC
jgi:hypothetical protein